jgi:integrase
MLNTMKSRPSLKDAFLLRQVSYEPQSLNFSELVSAYDAAKCESAGQRLKKWCEVLGEISAWEVSTDQLTEMMRAMVEDCGYAVASANRDLSAIGSVYRWAIERRICPPSFKSPTLGVRRFNEPVRRIYATDQELLRLRQLSLAFKDRRFSVFVHLLLETGARKSEILNRRWSDVDLEKREIILDTSKNGKPRRLYFSALTLKLMLRIYPERCQDELLFEGRVPNKPINYRASWKNLKSAVGREEIHIHDTRHFVSAKMIIHGTPLEVVGQALGNSAAVVARRYGHLEPNTLRKAVESQWTQQAMAPGLSP